MKKCVILCGPTAVGKTDISLEVAAMINAEIVNMDVGQFYTPLSIGTAKPAWKDMEIPHHLFDIINEPRNFSVVEYRERILSLLHNLWARGKVPLLVGGSAFYLYSLFFHISTEENKDKTGDLLQEKKVSWDYLYTLDPVRAREIHPHDHYRITRAIELFEKNKRQPSSLKPCFQPFFDADIIFLTRERNELYNRINQRVKIMFSQGFVDEVHLLMAMGWEDFLLQKKLIGYNEIIYYLRENTMFSLLDLEEVIAKRTRNYAKRQDTFWRYFCKKISQETEVSSMMPVLHTINLSGQKIMDSVQEIVKNIKN